MHFIVVDDRGRLIAGACSSPDVARLVALLDDEPASVRTLDVSLSDDSGPTRALPRGWRLLVCEDCQDGTHTDDSEAAVASPLSNATDDAQHVDHAPHDAQHVDHAPPGPPRRD